MFVAFAVSLSSVVVYFVLVMCVALLRFALARRDAFIVLCCWRVSLLCSASLCFVVFCFVFVLAWFGLVGIVLCCDV